ncbi:MAG: acetylxylan esterase [Armatimonadetes bacterium]|nr:acetylxylan esterase [Armatimonadota bacterium]
MPEGLEPYVPPGFEAFWRETTQIAQDAPLDYSVESVSEPSTPGHDLRVLSFRGISGERLHGWLAVPYSDVIHPGFLWIAPYSRWSMQPNEYGVRSGYTSLSFNFFGESAFHREDYTPARGYFADGVSSRETWIFRRMFQNAVIALRILADQAAVDENRLACAGMSQGGGIGIWMGAWVQQVKAVIADMPFLGGMPWVLQAKAFRYPLKELTDFMAESAGNDAAVRETLSYFDTINQASFCQVPTRVTLGLRDPAVRPEQARAVFDALPGVKELEEIDFGHDWHPRMIEGGQDWFRKHLINSDR